MARSDNLTGALLMMASMASFTINDTLMKAMAGQVPLNQLLFLRGVFTTLAVALIAWRMGALTLRLPRRDLLTIAVRMAAEIGAAYFFLTALFNMPIANVTAILQSLPLTITLAAAVFLHEPVGWRRMAAILAGLVGVMLIIRPGTEGFNSYALYTLLAVGFVTLRDLATRRLSPATPSMAVTFLTSAAIMTFFGVLSVGDAWAPMGTREAALTLGASVMIIGGYLFSIMVMRVGEIGFVAPFRYTGLLWALLLGWLVFGEWPEPLTLLGAAVVVASGLFTLYREARVQRRLRAERKTPIAPGPRPR